jgi:hypothetical protein
VILALLGLGLADELAEFDEAQRRAQERAAAAEAALESLPAQPEPEDPRQQLVRDWAPSVQLPVQEAWVRNLAEASVPAADLALYLRLECGPERRVTLLRSSGIEAVDAALLKAATEVAWPDPPAPLMEAFGGTFVIDLGFTLSADAPPEGKLRLP